MLSSCMVVFAFGGNQKQMTSLKILIEKHPDGFVAYPLGVKGVVVGEGDTYEEAVENIKDAIRLHIEDLLA